MGFNRALRTVFMALVIPSHVPLNRLPAATGLQLLFSGCFYLCCGPVVGESSIVFHRVCFLYIYIYSFFVCTKCMNQLASVMLVVVVFLLSVCTQLNYFIINAVVVVPIFIERKRK
jgi:hypothetical protein